MKKLFSIMFSEDSDISIMRIMSIISLAIAAILALKGMNDSVPTFVYAAFGGKAVQKFIEMSNGGPSKDA